MERGCPAAQARGMNARNPCGGISFAAQIRVLSSSSALAAAYGIAVTGAMFIDTCLIGFVLFGLWNWPKWKAWPLLGAFFVVDIAYLGANLLKVPDGGWFPLLIGLMIFTLLIISLAQNEPVRRWAARRGRATALLRFLSGMAPAALGRPFRPD